METADLGDEAKRADSRVVETEPGEPSEEIRVREEGVAAVEDWKGFRVDFVACGEDGGVDWGIAEEARG